MEFSVKGVKIKIGFLFAAVVAVLECFNSGGEIRAAILFSLLHEAGHLTAMLFCGEKPEKLSFGLFGMTITRRCDTKTNYLCEIITALAGPAVNFFLFFALYALSYALKSEQLLSLAAVNLFIGGFNGMPVFSLDGGRALEAFLKMRFDARKSDKIIKYTSFCVLTVMMAVGFYILIESGYNFTFLLIIVYLITILFIRC